MKVVEVLALVEAWSASILVLKVFGVIILRVAIGKVVIFERIIIKVMSMVLDSLYNVIV